MKAGSALRNVLTLAPWVSRCGLENGRVVFERARRHEMLGPSLSLGGSARRSTRGAKIQRHCAPGCARPGRYWQDPTARASAGAPPTALSELPL